MKKLFEVTEIEDWLLLAAFICLLLAKSKGC